MVFLAFSAWVIAWCLGFSESVAPGVLIFVVVFAAFHTVATLDSVEIEKITRGIIRADGTSRLSPTRLID